MMSSALGLGLVLFAVAEYVVRLRTARAPYTTHATDGYVLAGLLLVGASVGILHAPPWRFFVALGAAIAWFVGSRVYLRLRPPSAPAPAIGATLPAFDGRDELLAHAPAALVVLHGGPCPYDRAQLADALTGARALAEAALPVYFLAPGDAAAARATLGAARSEQLHVLADATGAGARALGDRPAAYLVDASGAVTWAKVARRRDDRAPTGELLWALRR